MSTINRAVFVASDEENDPDFIPDDSSESSDEDAQKAEVQSILERVDLEAERGAKEAARASLWAEFQSSVGATSRASSSDVSKQVKLVRVEKRHLFAGDIVSEIVEVPEDSEDANKWPLWNPSSSKAQEEAAPSNATSHDVADGTVPIETASKSPEMPNRSIPPTNSTEVTLPPMSIPETTRRRPEPRKPKTILTPLPSSKPKKLTTLEKSAMDWRAHITQAESGPETPPGVGLADELDRNRKSGGYLEKVAFLERVGNRREELFKDSRKKRRKG